MCQLLGLSSNKNVDIQLSLREFSHRGKYNPHGWGFAFYSGDKWEVVKEPGSLADVDTKSERFMFKSKIIIGHVRLASCGTKCHLNTHPFQRNGWAFAHNGTVSSIMYNKEFRLNTIKPLGQTDSEYAFCYLLEKIGQETHANKIKEILQKEADKIKKHGNFNFLLSDGKMLYTYGDDKLFFVQRKAPFQEVTLKDEGYSIHLSEIKSPEEKAILVATEPLTTGEAWKKFSGIKMFENGDELRV
jgi:glutamine amidotransferase